MATSREEMVKRLTDGYVDRLARTHYVEVREWVIPRGRSLAGTLATFGSFFALRKFRTC